MEFLQYLEKFFVLANETNYDLGQMYNQEPNAVYSFALVVLVLLLIIFFFIRRSIKISNALKLTAQIQSSSQFDEYDNKLSKLASELPKRGLKVAQSLNASKKEILKNELKLFKNFSMEEKLEKYQKMSEQYELIANNSKKHKISELTSFYENVSKSLLDKNLYNELKLYALNTRFEENEANLFDKIVNYANTRENKNDIKDLFISNLNRFSLTHNLNLHKFFASLSNENEFKSIYESEINNLFINENSTISSVVLNYYIQNDKEKVYKYIKNLKIQNHAQLLSSNLFGKSDNIDLDLAFVGNTVINKSLYASYIDSKLTFNWRDLAYIKHIIESEGVLECIGHLSYRNVLERIEKLESKEQENKLVSQALETARRAEEIAKEAKAIARSK